MRAVLVCSCRAAWAGKCAERDMACVAERGKPCKTEGKEKEGLGRQVGLLVICVFLWCCHDVCCPRW